MDSLYELGKTHIRQELRSIAVLLTFIDWCNFTCDQLHQIYLGIEDMKGSDYEDWIGFDDSDRSDELRESKDE